MKWIQEHNQASIAIHQINMIVRRSIANAFVVGSLVLIVTLFIAINTNEIFLKIFSILIFIFVLVIDFAISYLFTLLIKSAHQSQNLIYSILCKYKMRLIFEIKVNYYQIN